MAGSIRERAGLLPGRSIASTGSASAIVVYLTESLSREGHANAFVAQKQAEPNDNIGRLITNKEVVIYDVGFIEPFNSPIPADTFCIAIRWSGAWIYLRHESGG